MGVKRSLGLNNSRKVGELNGEREIELDQEWRKCLQMPLSSTFIYIKMISFVTLFKNRLYWIYKLNLLLYWFLY